MARRSILQRFVRRTVRRIRSERARAREGRRHVRSADPGGPPDASPQSGPSGEGAADAAWMLRLSDAFVAGVAALDARFPRRVAASWAAPQVAWTQWLPWVALLVLGWCWWATASSTALARVAAIQTVEPYAFAVHDQLVRNFAFDGQFFQTVHKGYDDAWTWSGHRALTLIAAGWLYPLDPSAFGLSRMMVVAFLAGGVPAALLGRQVARGAPVGLWIGGLVYLGSPAVMALALQDYQDLAFATPALVFAWWAMGAPGRLWPVVGTFVAMAPREECIPMAVGIAVLAIPTARSGSVRWGRWVWNVVAAMAVAGVYVWWAETYFPVSGGGHDMPLENAVKGVTGGGARDIFLDGWSFWDEFYIDLLLPVGFVALLGIEGVLPAAALIILHMTVPVGHGVDRAWSGHAHHMAPAAAFLAIAGTLALGRLVRWTAPARGRFRGPVHLAWSVGLAAVVWTQWTPFAAEQNFRVTASVEVPEWVHPAWRLARKLPADAIPIASKDVSPAISSFARSYTYDGSLRSKAKMEGLSAGTHMIVDTRQDLVAQWAMAMPQAQVVARDDPFVLVTWEPGSLDRRWSKMRTAKLSRPPPYVGRYHTPEQIPGVGPRASGQKLHGIVPRIRLPWAK